MAVENVADVASRTEMVPVAGGSSTTILESVPSAPVPVRITVARTVVPSSISTVTEP